MEQLILELAALEPPSLSNFLVGSNAEVVAALRDFVTGRTRETSLLVWGAPGAGKTHLLRASHALAREAGQHSVHYPSPTSADDLLSLESLPDLVIVDRIDDADADASARLFTVYNALKESGRRLMAASRAPPAAVAVREDLRTRLGWGLVYELFTLRDDEKAAALHAYALQRGFMLGHEVVEYWLRHGRRDMQSLLRTLAAVDRYSLSTRRPITIPLLRDWLQRESDSASHDASTHPVNAGSGSMHDATERRS